MYIQFLVRDWPVSAWIKFPLVCVVTSAILLATYQLFVRYTPIGTLLNGPRRRPPKAHLEQSTDPALSGIDTAG